MERFCSKCGSLVSGSFCPQCGTKMEGAVDLNKNTSQPADSQPQQPYSAPVQNEQYPNAGNSQSNTYSNNNNYAPIPNYPQNSNVNPDRYEPMSVGQWVGTIILSQLGIIGLILLLVWAFGDTPQPKKNFARGYLLAIVIVLAVVFIIGFACVGCLGIGMSELFDSSYYY